MSTANRNVRLGVVYRGSIIHEEVIDRRIDVSVGLRAGSTVQIPVKQYPDFPDSIELLLHEGGQFHLAVPSDPGARISLRGAGTTDTKTIKGKRAIPIETAAGGSMTLGDVSIMFQFVRGDTVPTITREHVVLRLGLVYDERLISDRIFPDMKKVSIGNTKADTVVLPEEDYQGPSITFENHKDGSATLKAPATMKVKLAIDGSPMELKDLIAKGKARQEGNDIVCHLGLGTRGRATMGQHTVLFQIVKQTVTVPAFAQRSLMSRLSQPFLGEPTWTLSFAVAVLLIGGIVGQALLFQHSTGRYLSKSKIEEQNTRTTYEVQVEIKEEIKEEEPEEEKKETIDVVPEEVKAKVKEEKKEKAPDKVEKPAEKPQSTGKQVDPEEMKRQARDAVVKKSIAGALVGAGGAATKLFGEAGDGEGEVVAKTFGGDGGTEKGEAPGSGLKLAGGGGGGGTMEKVKTGGAKGFGDRKADDVKVEAKKEEVAVKVSLGGLDGGEGGESKQEIGKIISRKNAAVQRCYETALRDNPDLSGKVKVTFTVGTAGTITDVSVSGATGPFEDCIKSKFSAIRGLPLLPSPQSFSQSYVFSKS
jgi:outer membrane biosynthesis protein TonB